MTNNVPNQPAALTSNPLRDYYRERALRCAAERRALPDELRAGGVCRVTAEYNGCGDSGCIEDLQFFDSAAKPIADEVLGALVTRTQSFFDDVIDLRHPGWENNSGGEGSIEWLLTEDKFHHSHTTFFEDSDTTEYNGLDDVSPAEQVTP